MVRATRSRSVAALDRVKEGLIDGSKLDAAVSGQILQKMADAELVVGENLSIEPSDDIQVSVDDSSSRGSEGAVEGDGRSVVSGVFNSVLPKVVGGRVADHVLDNLPQSGPIAADVDMGCVASVGASEKAKGGTPKAPWVNLFKDNRNLGGGIKLDVVDSVDEILQIGEEDVDDVEEAWGCCLVGQFAGRFPGLAAVRTIVESWKIKCHHRTHRSGWIIFKFESNEDRMCVLNGGPYFIYGRNLMLKSMPKCFRFGGEEIATVPVWVQLPELPLDCWNARALSKIDSRVGKPITTDRLTRSKERLSYARVLVEVDASKDLVTSVEMRLPTGVIYDQPVVFEFKPKYCKKCKSFRHGDGDCNIVKEGNKQSVYVAKRGGRQAVETGNKKGDGNANLGDAGVPSGMSEPVLVQSVPLAVVDPPPGALSGGSKADSVPVLLPEQAVLAADNSVPSGGPGIQTGGLDMQQDDGHFPDAEWTNVHKKGKQKKYSEHRTVAADQTNYANRKVSSVRIREPVNASGKGKESGGGVQCLQAAVKGKRSDSSTEEGGHPDPIIVKSVRGDSLDLGVMPLSSGGKVKGGSMLGGGAANKSSQAGSGVKGAAVGVHRICPEDCEAEVGAIMQSDRIATYYSAAKKSKGKAAVTPI